MYTDTNNPNHMAQEVIYNAVDEVIARFATKIYLKLFEDGSLSVNDNGRGIPANMHSKEKMTGIEVVMLMLNSNIRTVNFLVDSMV